MEQLSKWHRELDIFCQIKSGLILEGNIKDVFSYPEGEYSGSLMRLTQYLYFFFRAKGYDTIVCYDPLQGFTNPYSSKDLERFGKLSGVNVAHDRVDAPFSGAANSAPELLESVLTQTESAVAVLFDLASRTIAGPDRMEPEEIRGFTRIQQAIAKAASVKGGNGMLRNLILLITDKQNDLPAWFFLDNPMVKTIPVGFPTAAERKSMLSRERLPTFFQRDLFQKDLTVYEGAEEELNRLVDRFVARTEGFSNYEMNNLRNLARNTGVRLPELCSVVDLYTYGIRDNPWQSRELSEKMNRAQDIFERRVKGQNAAIQQTLDVVKRSVVGLSGGNSAKPKGVLFFAGPTGTGKTETAKTLAELLFGDEKACIRFDMSEYSQSHSDQRLLGAPPGYVGYEAGGQLTNAIRQNPFCILLFDEIEKAAPSIMDKFLQILEDGRMTDGQGHTVYFSECIIIFTSNLGISVENEYGHREANVTMDMPYDEMRLQVRRAIEDHFKLRLGRPEILNRIGENIVVFDYIRPKIAEQILRSRLEKIKNSLWEEKHIRLSWSEEAFLTLLEMTCANLENGGRGVGNVVESAWINPLSRFLFDRQILSHKAICVTRVCGETTPVTIECEVGPNEG